MVADVQAWLDNPTENFGWIVIGNESTHTTAKRFDTWENSNAVNHPKIEVTYDASSCVDCDPEDLRPGMFVLLQNYPNPFNPTTTLRFDLADAAEVRLDIVNAAGQTVRTLMECDKNAGSNTVSWNGEDASGRRVPSGVYYRILHLGSTVRTLKMLLMK